MRIVQFLIQRRGGSTPASREKTAGAVESPLSALSLEHLFAKLPTRLVGGDDVGVYTANWFDRYRTMISLRTAASIDDFDLAEVVNSDNAGVAQTRQGFSFAIKTLREVAALAGCGSNDFQCYHSIKIELSSFIDDPHASIAQQFQNLKLWEVSGQFCGRWWRGFCRR